MPQEQRQANLEPGLAGNRPLQVEIAGSAAGPPQKHVSDLRPRPHPLGEGRVEQRQKGAGVDEDAAHQRVSPASSSCLAAVSPAADLNRPTADIARRN